MIVSIMQPYFLPYIGYFQLMAASDVFVCFDTAQYIKDGWVNRNRILHSDGEAAWITLPVKHADHSLSIGQREYLLGDAERIVRRIESEYRKAPHFEAVFPFIRDLLRTPEPNVAMFNMKLVGAIADRLGIRKPRLLTSDMPRPSGIDGEAKVLEFCKYLGATGYLNLSGGRELYRAEQFQSRGLSLHFIETTIEPQLGKYPYLSIIHLLMNEDEASLIKLLTRYKISPTTYPASSD